MLGSAEPGVMVHTPAAWPGSVTGIEKRIVSTVAEASASSIAARRVQAACPAELTPPVEQIPLPGVASAASVVAFT